MGADVEPFDGRGSAGLEAAVQLGVDAIDIGFGGETTRHDCLVGDDDEMDPRGGERLESLGNAGENPDLIDVGEEMDVLDENAVAVEEDGAVHATGRSSGRPASS